MKKDKYHKLFFWGGGGGVETRPAYTQQLRVPFRARKTVVRSMTPRQR